jgi:hypothetical protein
MGPGTYREALIMATKKRAHKHGASIWKLIPLSRELTVSANPGMLRK